MLAVRASRKVLGSWVKHLIGGTSLLVSLISMTGCSLDQPSGSSIQQNPDSPEIFSESNIVNFGLRNTKSLVLTFDDGPDPVATMALLDLLRQHNVKATFFIVGKHVAGNESVMQQMARDGHVIASHTFTHANLRSAPIMERPERLMYQVMENHRAILPYHNPQHRWYFRAPFGSWTPQHAATLNMDPIGMQYIGPIFWNVGGELKRDSIGVVTQSADWACWENGLSARECGDGYLQEIERQQGGVVLMHDKDPKPQIFTRTPEMMAYLLPILRARGYRFVTLDQVRALDRFQ